MKKNMLACALALLLLGGCKTTEANYQAAYQIARDKTNDGLTEEEIDGMMRQQSMPQTVYRGDSIALMGAYVKLVERADNPETTRPAKYNVVVVSFKQLFNARSAYRRLVEAGYTTASICEDADRRYYVSAYGAESLDEVVPLYKALLSSKTVPKDFPLAVKTPYIMKAE